MNSPEPKSRYVHMCRHGMAEYGNCNRFCMILLYFPSCLHAHFIQTGKKTSQQHVINQARYLFLLRCGNKGCRIRLLEVRHTRSRPHAQSIYLELGTAVAFLHQSLNSTHGTQNCPQISRNHRANRSRFGAKSFLLDKL